MKIGAVRRPGTWGVILLGLVLGLAAWPASAGAEPQPGDVSPPIITHEPVKRAPAGRPIVIRARIEDPSGVFAPSVLVRPKGTGELDTINMRRVAPGLYEATIPAEQASSDLEYFIEAFDEAGNGPARMGTPDRPLVIHLYDATRAATPPIPQKGTAAPPPSAVTAAPLISEAAPRPRPESVTSRWWFWTIVGVAVAGAATAVYFASRPQNVDHVDLIVRGPDPTSRL